MLKLTHTFKVWHPKDGLPADYVETEFEFTYPVSRQFARYDVEKVHGYCVQRVHPPRQRSGITKTRRKKQKIR